MNDQEPSQITRSIPQSTPQINPETPSQNKSNLLIYFGIVLLIVIILGAIFLFYENKKHLAIKKYNAIIKTLTQVSSSNTSTNSLNLIPTPLVFTNSPTTKDSRMLISSTGNADLLMTNHDGKQTGYKDSQLIQKIPGAHIQTHTTSMGAAPPSYNLPADLYTILIEGKDTDTSTIDIFWGGKILEIQALPVTKGSRDLITVNNSNRALEITTSGNRKIYNADLMIVANGSTKEFSLTGLTITKGEQETFAMSDDGNSLEISNNAQQQNIQVTFELLKENSNSQKSLPVTINSGDKIIITLSDWNNLEKTQISVKKDG